MGLELSPNKLFKLFGSLLLSKIITYQFKKKGIYKKLPQPRMTLNLNR